MSYIDVENDGIRYRVILGSHEKTKPISQLPESCTGILLEGSTADGNKESMFNLLEGVGPYAKEAFVMQYANIRSEAQNRGLPLVTTEPRASSNAFLYGESFISPFGALQMHLAGRWIVDRLRREGKLLIGSPDYLKAQQFIDLYCRKNPNMLIKPKDLLLAEGIVAFAEFQRINGIREPYLATIVGSMHLGTIKEIIKPRDQRIVEIFQNRQINDYYRSDSLGEIYYIIFDSEKHSWSRHVLSNHRLKHT